MEKLQGQGKVSENTHQSLSHTQSRFHVGKSTLWPIEIEPDSKKKKKTANWKHLNHSSPSQVRLHSLIPSSTSSSTGLEMPVVACPSWPLLFFLTSPQPPTSLQGSKGIHTWHPEHPTARGSQSPLLSRCPWGTSGRWEAWQCLRGRWNLPEPHRAFRNLSSIPQPNL